MRTSESSASSIARAAWATDLDQSFGFETTLNFGAAGESPMRQSSTSRPKKRMLSSVILFSQSSVDRCSSVNRAEIQINRHSLEARGIGQELPKVAMIGAFKLVFDKHPCARAEILAQDVSAERADSLFLRLQFQVDPKRLTQDREIHFPCEPGRESRLLHWSRCRGDQRG